MTMLYYPADYKNIISHGFHEKLSEETIDTIKELCDDLGVLFYPTKLRNFSIPHNTGGGRSRGVTSTVTDGDWETLRSGGGGAPTFKPTIIPKKEGFDKQITDIRACLNKISEKNHETQYMVFIELVRDIFSVYDFKSPEGEKTINTILELCQLNKFYSKVYTDIYVKLAQEYPIFSGDFIKNKFEESYIKSFSQIHFVDPNVDYDKFCEYNKENEKRKSIAMFYINLMKSGNFDHIYLVNCIQQLLEYVFLFMDEEGKTNEIEEITENINILYTNTQQELSNMQEWEEIVEKIQELSQKKHTNHKSLSNRAIFKFMDMADI